MTDKFQKIAEEIVNEWIREGSEHIKFKAEDKRMLQKRISQSLQSLASSLAKKFLDAVPEWMCRDVPNEMLKSYTMSVEAAKISHNAARSKLLEVIKQEGIEVKV